MNINIFVENSVSVIKLGLGEKVTCIFHVAATGTKRIQSIMEVILKLIFMKVIKPL